MDSIGEETVMTMIEIMIVMTMGRGFDNYSHSVKCCEYERTAKGKGENRAKEEKQSSVLYYIGWGRVR